MAETESKNTLLTIQSVLKAPKNQHNSFGKYDYRSAEDILNALKPILKAYNSTLVLSDLPVLIGDWHYIKATATLKTPDDEYTVTAYARESEAKKGMDSSQITGTASSYARKYALNGMFLIDDTKDADTNAYHQQNSDKQAPRHNDSALIAKKKLVTGMYQKIAISMKTDVNTVRKEAIAQATANPNWKKYDDAGKQAILLRILAAMEKTLIKQ
ncbi:ERF family protein [Liquorilactobacillus nagelii]|uniref:ERF family protein n=1 Tax=Liquorilactobacillus nagelii TaxID=82688 RepID=UPI001CCC2F41|nr:ERF family protein [Liquorilactobacillus nagelii]ULQ49029.1 ERF family protein [Liquorilactobacillus nagelii]